MNEYTDLLVKADGMNGEIVYYLLLIPFIALIATLLRHIAGIKTLSFGVFMALIFVMGFLVKNHSLYSAIGGFLLIFFIYFISYYVKKFSVNAGMHYFARISFVLTVVSIVVLLSLIIVYQLDFIKNEYNFALLNPFAIILAVALGEQFSSHQIQKGIKASRKMFFSTLFWSFLLSLVASYSVVEAFVLDYPYIIFIALIINFIAGRYQGIRLTELIRFQSVAKSDQESKG
jgi:hypothetical protein